MWTRKLSPVSNLKSSHGGPWTYTYDDENQMTNVNSSATWRSDLVYDGLQRLRKRLEYTWTSSGGTNGSWSLSSTTLYIYDGMRVIQERSSTTTPSVSYTRGADLSGSLEGAGGIGGLLSRSHAYQSGSGSFTNHNYYHADGNGNITYMVDTNQSMVATYRYDPFGNSISSSGTLASANVYRFSSKERHNNSGMYYYGYRWYDPNLQRWLNRDPIQEEGGINLYGFVRNSPFSVVDAEGLRWFSYFPVLNVLNCFLAEPGEKPGDYNSIPPPSCDKCKEDAELAEDECKRAVARKEAQNIGNVMGPMIVSGVGDLILGGISIAVPPVWIGTGIGVIGTACEVKAMMNIDKAAKQYSDKNCKCPK